MPTSTSEFVDQERIPIHDCANKDFGVGMFRDAGADQSIVTVVLGKPAPPVPAAKPAPFQEFGTVIGGDLDVWDIAHNDVPDPATGVQGAKVGTLANGSQVYIGRPCQNGWCQVNTNQIPRGFGFVEQSHVQIS